MEVLTEFTFEAAHRLPNVPAEHKCARLHGHSFRVIVRASGPFHDHLGWVIDFGDIKKAVQPIVDQLDHRYLNEIDGLENPTAENLAYWLWERVSPRLSLLSAIEVRETCTSACVLRREDVLK